MSPQIHTHVFAAENHYAVYIRCMLRARATYVRIYIYTHSDNILRTFKIAFLPTFATDINLFESICQVFVETAGKTALSEMKTAQMQKNRIPYIRSKLKNYFVTKNGTDFQFPIVSRSGKFQNSEAIGRANGRQSASK